MMNKPSADTSVTGEIIHALQNAADSQGHQNLSMILSSCAAVEREYGADKTFEALLTAYVSIMSLMIKMMSDAGRPPPNEPGLHLRAAGDLLERSLIGDEPIVDDVAPARAVAITFVETFAARVARSGKPSAQSIGDLARALVPVIRREGYVATMDLVLNLYCSLSMSAMMSGRLEGCPVNRMSEALEHFRSSVEAYRSGATLPPGNYDITPGPLDGPVAGRA